MCQVDSKTMTSMDTLASRIFILCAWTLLYCYLYWKKNWDPTVLKVIYQTIKESEFCVVSFYCESIHNYQLLTILDPEVKCVLISLCFNKIFWISVYVCVCMHTCVSACAYVSVSVCVCVCRPRIYIRCFIYNSHLVFKTVSITKPETHQFNNISWPSSTGDPLSLPS